MTIINCLFLYYLAIRIFVKQPTRKNYFITISIVTALMLLSDITYIISVGIINYVLYLQGWQIVLSYLAGVIYIFKGTVNISTRKIKFNIKSKYKDEIISTAKGRTTTYAILSLIMLSISVGLLLLYINDVTWSTPQVFIAPVIIVIFLIMLLIKNAANQNEEFVLVTWISNNKNVYRQKIGTTKFNYKDIVGELSKIYFIYKVSTVQVSGDIHKTEYVYLLKVNELNYGDLNSLDLTLDNSIDPDIYINLYNNKKTKAKIKITKNEIKVSN